MPGSEVTVMVTNACNQERFSPLGGSPITSLPIDAGAWPGPLPGLTSAVLAGLLALWLPRPLQAQMTLLGASTLCRS